MAGIKAHFLLMEYLETFKKLEETIGITFHNKELLSQAFTHRSFLNENPTYTLGNNERLEFLGDAVLELLVSKYLYDTYDDPEGILTIYRTAIVRTESLAQIAKDLHLGQFLLLGKGEKNSGGEDRPYILANTFEALLGAVYLDQGLSETENFLQKFLFPSIHEIIEKGKTLDSKSILQELAQQKTHKAPVYRVLKEEGPEHDKMFTIEVLVDNKVLAEGKGKSKQDAQQDAASKALNKI